MTTPQLFDTTGMDSTTLNQAALLLSQNLGNGTPTSVTGPYASQLVSLAGGQLNSQGLVTSADPSFLQNIGGAINSHLWGASIAQLTQDAKKAGAIASSNPVTSLTSWIGTSAANFSLIAFGAVIAVAALIYSQRENIQTVVKQAGKVAALAA